MPYLQSSQSALSLVLASLPRKPGVYFFKNTLGEIIYVGKAKSLRDRVSSYFQATVKLESKTAKLVSQITTIEHIEVGSEVEALLLESRLIKKFKPIFNIISKDDKSPYYIHITKEKYPRPIINHTSQSAIAGPFLTSFIAKKILRLFRHVAPFCTAKNPKRPCLYSHLGLCNPCPGDQGVSLEKYKKNIRYLKKLLSGEFAKVSKDLKKSMLEYSKATKYEEAGKLKAQIEYLDHLLSAPVSPDEYIINPNLQSDLNTQANSSLKEALNLPGISRIELYDIANLQGTSATAAMTVSVNGEISTDKYRHFNIKTIDSPNDVQMLKEVLSRRLKRKDWPMPDLIVLDGGQSQLSIVNWSIPTIALAKQKETIHFPGGSILNLPSTHPGLRLLQRLRDEAHRFSRRLHHKRRAKALKI